MAWATGDRPGALDFRHAPSPGVAAALVAALAGMGIAADRFAALQPAESPVGRYRADGSDGPLFLRVSSRIGQPALEQAITGHLAAAGVPVNPILAVGALVWQGDSLRVDVRPYLAGRHFAGDPADLAAVAATLRSCHRALADYPAAAQVASEAADWNARIDDARHRLGGGDLAGLPAGWAMRRRPWLAEAMAGLAPDWHSRAGAQVVHGELHAANVMFDAAGTAVLVDFEEATHAFAPPAWDLAYLVQRFCLADDPGRAALEGRLDRVRAGYGPLPPLGRWMRDLAWYVVAHIASLGRSGIATPEVECEKFVRLERQGARLEEWGL